MFTGTENISLARQEEKKEGLFVPREFYFQPSWFIIPPSWFKIPPSCFIIQGTLVYKTNTWPISDTECYKWAQIERLGFWDPGPYPSEFLLLGL